MSENIIYKRFLKQLEDTYFKFYRIETGSTIKGFPDIFFTCDREHHLKRGVIECKRQKILPKKIDSKLMDIKIPVYQKNLMLDLLYSGSTYLLLYLSKTLYGLEGTSLKDFLNDRRPISNGSLLTKKFSLKDLHQYKPFELPCTTYTSSQKLKLFDYLFF
jgi:hypothetical protein